MYYLKYKVKAINMSDYTGYNDKNYSQDIKKICNILQGIGYWGPNLLIYMLNIFKNSRDKHM